MALAEASITEFPITQGQSEGQAVQVLPVGQFSAVRNARFRKQNRLGKRNGYDSISSLDADGAALGSGSGLLTCLGPEFCVVDDVYYQRDTVADVWRATPRGALTNRNLFGRFPQFVPGITVSPATQISSIIATRGGGGMVYALGYIWTAEARLLSANWVIHVEAIDPATLKTVWVKDIALTSTNLPGVQLLVTLSGKLVLLTDAFTAGTKSGVITYVLSSLAVGFAPGVTFACIQSAANTNFNVTAGRGDCIAFTWAVTATPGTVRVGWLDAVTGATVASTTFVAAGNATLMSVFCDSLGFLRVGFRVAAVPEVRALFFNSTPVLVSNVSLTATGYAGSGPMLFVESDVAAQSVIAIGQDGDDTAAFDVTSAGFALGLARQINTEALSWPFRVGQQMYVWLRYRAGVALGVATLVRIPDKTEYTGGVNAGTWPAQATVDDRDIDSPLPTGRSGPVFPTPVATPIGYAALLNYTRDSAIFSGIEEQIRAYLVVTTRHRAEGVRYAASCVFPCWGRQFICAAQPMLASSLAPYEAGFIQAPYIVSAVGSAGGGLTAGANYSYTAIFQSVDANGIERSAPATPVTIAMGANDLVTLTITPMALGYRQQVTCRVYRTLANGSVWQYCSEFDASPGANNTGTITVVDGQPDSSVSQNETLYINIGQELPASNFPACTFGNTGGNRLWLGGGFVSNVVQASKTFMPRIAPEFADDDAFRVTLPSACTGMAWLDSQVLFTQEGIYVVSGDGPDVSGAGFFTLSRLPFDIGCIDWRSVDVTDSGIFFQSARGLRLLPRGFGPPIAMDQVLDTLSSYPIITSARSSYNSASGADNSEQVVQWTATVDEAATSGVVITYDVAYQAFYVDTYGADYPPTFQAGWSGDSVQAPAITTVGPNGASYWHPFRMRNDLHSDGGLPIAMSVTTGDVRPWGTFAHGVINRVGVLGVLGSACTLTTTKLTNRGTATASRVYTGVAPDYVPGSDVYLDVELGNTEQRDVTAVRFTFSESSTVEGLAFIGLVIETDTKNQGYRLLKPSDRIT